MSSLIVIRIIPPKTTEPGKLIPPKTTKTTPYEEYLNPTGLGPLQITAYELSFNNPTEGKKIGTATYIAPATGPSPTGPVTPPPMPVFKSPKYAGTPTSGIVQQYDLAPEVPPDTAYYELEAVATAVIEVPTAAKIENLRLVAQWGSGAGATLVPLDDAEFYDVQLSPGPAPDLNAWAPTSSTVQQPDPWGALTPSLYLQLPAPPTSASPFSFNLPTDGTPPAFGTLLKAVQKILSEDPGAAFNVATSSTAAAGDLKLTFPAATSGISVGMSASVAGIPAGTTVVSADATVLVTLSHELSAAVPSGTSVKFEVNLGALSVEQCRNIAYEIVWSQQPPPPIPPSPVEDLYTNPPNAGKMLSGTTPNQFEADRQQFEADLMSYYALADAAADRLTNFVYALSAAVTCEQQSLAATEVLLDFPSNPAMPAAGSLSGQKVVLTGINTVAPPTNFGVPAAYFYALAAQLPLQIGPAQRLQLATGDQLARLLVELTSALNSGTVTDSESFVAVPAVSINAAQAARRIATLSVPIGSKIPRGPLGTRTLQTTSATTSGKTLSFASTVGLQAGMLVSGRSIALSTTIASLTDTTVTLSAPPLGDIAAGDGIAFVPAYSAGLVALLQSWLAYPPAIIGDLSTQSYLATDDATKFWPAAASAQPAAFLNLVLAVLTEGFIVPAPFNVALGDLIISKLLLTQTVAALLAVTRAQWTRFFEDNPTWLPPGIGNAPARIAAFFRRLQTFFGMGLGDSSASFVLATSGVAAAGSNVLQFPPTTAIFAGMSVSGPNIAPGTSVTGVATSATTTTVTLNVPIGAGGVPANSNITFSVNAEATAATTWSTLPAPSQDWFVQCLTAYGAFTLGSGFDLAKLRAAAATVFPDDDDAQEWMVQALVTLDALYAVMKSVALSPPGTPAFAFSVVEALYARGFTSAASITQLSIDALEQALTGTVAFELASKIHASAAAISPPAAEPADGTDDVFAPINPDGTLVNCVPPPCASPLGPIAYLNELLSLSELSTCAEPLASSISMTTSTATAAGQTLPFVSAAGLIPGMSVSGTGIPNGTTLTEVGPSSVTMSNSVSATVPAGSVITFTAPTLQSVIGKRRGPIGDLAASCANLETPLPAIDLVNECLEYMGSVANPISGTVYDTTADEFAGHKLCKTTPCPPDECEPPCHEPARVFGALPEYSTPATPVAANSGVTPAVWNILKKDFSSCELPYSQALDASRTYLRHFGSCRVEEMRTFRKCITEFVLDPSNEPAGFQDHLWRFPVRIDTAIEYLGISPGEYELLFAGTPAPACAMQGLRPQEPGHLAVNLPPLDRPNPDDLEPRLRRRTELAVWSLYGFTGRGDNERWTDIVVRLPEFLTRTCLTYCEFYELWKSDFVPFTNGSTRDGAFPECEPCCLDRLSLHFPGEQRDTAQALTQLIVFIRLWRKLKDSCCFCYSFAQLRDICNVLHLFDTSGARNPEFIRQLAAFQILRDHFCLDLTDERDKPAATALDAERTHLLALWVGPTATKWGWAVRRLCEKVALHAKRCYRCDHRSPEFVEWLVSKLDVLSRLAGFSPTSATDNWHALPTHTLRFAEVLAKLAASNFTLPELIYLFTVDDQHCGDIFPLQDECDAHELPLGLPAEECEFSLWHLRRKLLQTHAPALNQETGLHVSLEVDGTLPVEGCVPEEDHRRQLVHVAATISQECADEWDWRRVVRVLEEEIGYALDDILDLGRHLFPHILEKAGYLVDSPSTRYTSDLAAAQTNPAMWSAAADGSFQYDAAAGKLWTHIPVADRSVISQLVRLNALNAKEQQSVQDLYFQPRAMLALFAALFPDFPAAERQLIEERDECERWEYFRRHVAQCHQRCHVIARHLAEHVAKVTCQPCPDGEAVAMLILRELFGDENKATADWESDNGSTPPVTWTPPANGGAFAALLGLTGTGLVMQYKAEGGGLVWRNVSGALDGFGAVRDAANAPVPTVLPAIGATITPALAMFASVRNGFLVKNGSGALLGGAQGFEVTWSGALLVDEEGSYEFCAAVPSSHHHKHDCEPVDRHKWRVVLKRGSRSWVLLSHRWLGEEECHSACRQLKCGAYELTVELVRPAPEFTNESQVQPQHTGLEVKYSGPDTCGERIAIPRCQLFSILKDDTLGQGISTAGAGASLYLARHYTSTLRDIRRTYQRAFKALLFAHRFALAAQRNCQGTSELGYMLEEAEKFAGAAYFRTGGAFAKHAANFDFDFLPLVDVYYPPAADSRTHPSAKRTQAMFDWWERIFDYTFVRKEVRCQHDRELWHLFAEARATNPSDPAPLLAHLGTDPRFWKLVLRYYQGQVVPVYAVTSADLQDDRWTVRTWHSDEWLSALDCHFAAKDITVARPDLWASEDPSALVADETETGNANLSAFVCDGCLEHGDPRRYDELRRLNDGLRQRGRNALVAYLCNQNRVALPWSSGQFATVARDLSDLLLIDVETGVCEKLTRIEDAIAAVQGFVRRARLHLEPTWTVTREFVELWDRQLSTFHIWQACKRRRFYKENWIEWSDLEKARSVEAFRFLESELRSPTLTAAVPGGAEWWPDHRPPASEPEVLQQHEPSSIQLLTSPREGINLLGTPERDARPSWLSAVQGDSERGRALAPGVKQIPLWMESAIRLGTKFYRIAAAGTPPAALLLEPRARTDAEECVTCCKECGCHHPPLVDEYFFWLIPSELHEPPPSATLNGAPTGYVSAGDYQNGFQDDCYDPIQQQSAVWQDPEQLPQLLQWEAKPAVRLAWCRIHNGELQQPRRSVRALRVEPTQSSDLVFLGRTVDSLTFSVTNGITPDGYKDPALPGFRFDLPSDSATVLPELIAPKAPPDFLGASKLPAYPWFLFHEAGASLIPLSPFVPALTVARALRSHCRFEAALAWYRSAFDPLKQDNTWINCDDEDDENDDRRIRGERRTPPAACCDSTAVSCDQSRNRSVVLHYLETLVEWGGAVMRHGRSVEAIQQARVILESAVRILGETPQTVIAPEAASPQKVSSFTPEPPQLNPRLFSLYETVRNQLENIRICANDRRLRDGARKPEIAWFGNDSARDGWRTSLIPCDDDAELCFLRSPYRFTFLLQKAQDYAMRVQELGSALLNAFEKGDAEYLASLRSGHERELLTLGFEARKDAWREADWQIEVLQRAKDVAQANLVYYTDLKARGLIAGEVAYEALTMTSTYLRTAGNALEAASGVMGATGNFFNGVAGFGGTPLIYMQLPPGEPLAGGLAANARVMVALSDISSSMAGLSLTEAGWQRRLEEWSHQVDVLTIEIQQIERQILAAQRRRDQVLTDLNTHRRQMEHSQDVQNFLREKFTAHNLYLHLQKETCALHCQTYELALRAAFQAQHAFQLERGHTARRFIPECNWDSLHEGLMAGERLSAALRQMEKAYLDENVREYELTKHISLRQQFPAQYLQLRMTGSCEIEIPEWMFDLDFPGQYMRRIKSVALTFPCVTGPYTGVHCRLTLLGSVTRVDPRISAPPHECCCPKNACCDECNDDEHAGNEYMPCADDPRFVRQFGAREAVATSSGQNDSGLFVLDFNDQRYLPFEYMGAISRWRIEVPPENNYWDMNTCQDVNMRLLITACEGGPPLRRAAQAAARNRLPGDGWRLIDVRHEFPDAYQRLVQCSGQDSHDGRLRIRLERKMFPFVPGGREIRVEGMGILFSRHGHETCDACKHARRSGCPCPEHRVPAHSVVDYRHGVCGSEDSGSVNCIVNEVWGQLYCGSLCTSIGMLGGRRQHAELELHFHAHDVDQVFLLCRYSAADCSLSAGAQEGNGPDL